MNVVIENKSVLKLKTDPKMCVVSKGSNALNKIDSICVPNHHAKSVYE